MNEVSVFTVLTQSPYAIAQLQNQEGDQGFFQMIKSMIAPAYKLKSFTSIIIFLTLAIYVILVLHYPPYLRIPAFSLKPLQLLPEDLRHFEFYRLFTAPLVCPDITILIMNLLVLWSLCSYTQERVGWKILMILSNLSGLIGYASFFSIPMTLLGMNIAFNLIRDLDSHVPVPTRKMLFLLNLIIIATFLLIFYQQQDEIKYSVYASASYGLGMGFIIGKNTDPINPSTIHQVIKASSTILIIITHFILIFLLVFGRKTFL